jgi:hypothetical protein
MITLHISVRLALEGASCHGVEELDMLFSVLGQSESHLGLDCSLSETVPQNLGGQSSIL